MKRIDALDSLRGLAAVSVMMSHILICYPLLSALNAKVASERDPITVLLTYSPLHLVWAGTPAVLLFFTLSGFVLALPFLSSSPPTYRAFVIRRFFRIYVPYAAALIVAIAALSMITVEPVPNTGQLPGLYWDGHMTPGGIAGYLLMTGLPHHMKIDPVVWSLIHEMRLSLIFPLLFYVTSAAPAALRVIGFLAISFACTMVLNHMPHPADGGSASFQFLQSLLETGTYVWLFVLGIELARYRFAIAKFDALIPSSLKAAIFILAASFYLINWLVPGMTEAFAEYPAGIGAASFIVLILISSAVQRVLVSPPLLMVGRSSYSLYLLHVIVLLTLIYALHRYVPMIAISIITPIVSIGLAVLMYRTIEQPAIKVGRYLTTPDNLKQPASSFVS